MKDLEQVRAPLDRNQTKLFLLASVEERKEWVQAAKENTVYSRYLEVLGTIFYKFKLPEVQINLHFG